MQVLVFKPAADTYYMPPPSEALGDRKEEEESAVQGSDFVHSREELSDAEASWAGQELASLLDETDSLEAICTSMKKALTRQFGSSWHVVASEKTVGCAYHSDGLSVRLADPKKKVMVVAWRYTPSLSTMISQWIPWSSVPTILTFIAISMLIVHYFAKGPCESCCPDLEVAVEAVCDQPCTSTVCRFILGPMWTILATFAIAGMVLRFFVKQMKTETA